MVTGELLAEYAQNLEEAHMSLSALRDPTEQVLARKAILQAGVLGFSDEVGEFEDEQPIDIGIFRVFPTEAAIDWTSPSGELEIRAGQIYLDFHIPKSDNISNTSANEGYTKIAELMKTRPAIEYIMGVTYRVMAISARRNQGFNTEELVLPPAVMNFASAYWQNMIPDAKSKQFQTAHVVWQDRESFINRFGSTIKTN